MHFRPCWDGRSARETSSKTGVGSAGGLAAGAASEARRCTAPAPDPRLLAPVFRPCHLRRLPSLVPVPGLRGPFGFRIAPVQQVEGFFGVPPSSAIGPPVAGSGDSHVQCPGNTRVVGMGAGPLDGFTEQIGSSPRFSRFDFLCFRLARGPLLGREEGRGRQARFGNRVGEPVPARLVVTPDVRKDDPQCSQIRG